MPLHALLFFFKAGSPLHLSECASRLVAVLRWRAVSSYVSRSLLTVVLCCLATSLHAQPHPGSITTRDLPMIGPIITDKAGNVYGTPTVGQPTPGAAQLHGPGPTPSVNTCSYGGPVPLACTDATVTKLDASGNVVFTALMGSPANDGNFALALDADQNIYMAGFTYGSLPTTTQAAVPNMTSTTVPGGSPFQMFAAKLSADGSRFLYITYLPDDLTNPTAIAIDPVGNAYVTGNSSAGEVWVIKINPTGTAFGYRVVLGGSYIQRASSLAIDSAGNLLVAGETMSVDFPVTTGAIQSKLRGSTNVFLTKLDPSGRVLLSTYLGGSGQDSSPSVALASSGCTPSLRRWPSLRTAVRSLAHTTTAPQRSRWR